MGSLGHNKDIFSFPLQSPVTSFQKSPIFRDSQKNSLHISWPNISHYTLWKYSQPSIYRDQVSLGNALRKHDIWLYSKIFHVLSYFMLLSCFQESYQLVTTFCVPISVSISILQYYVVSVSLGFCAFVNKRVSGILRRINYAGWTTTVRGNHLYLQRGKNTVYKDWKRQEHSFVDHHLEHLAVHRCFFSFLIAFPH